MGEVNRSLRNKKLVQRNGLPRRLKDMSKEQLQAALLKKKECNSRALLIVERLLENTVDEEWFLESLKYISDSHFQDIIEERVILKQCGYALCHQILKSIPTQQYRISTKLNKVYDISERKNFCSNQCYTASKYIKDQLLSSPLWLRDKEDIPEFKVLPLGTTGTGAGEEVDIGQNNIRLKEEIAQLKTDDSFTSIAQFTQDSLSALSKKIDTLEKKEEKKVHFKEEVESSLDNRNAEFTKEEKKHVQFEDKNILPKTDKSDSKVVKSSDVQDGCSNSAKCPTDTEKETKQKPATSVSTSSDEITIRLGNICEVASKTESTTDLNGNTTDILDSTSLDEHKTNITDRNDSSEKEVKEGTSPEKSEKKIKERTTRSKSKHKKMVADVPLVTNSIIHIEKCLQEWFTIDSMCFLFGEEKVKEMVLDKGECFEEYYKIVGSTTRDAAMREKYEAILRRLNLLELNENKFDAETRQMKPLPDYRVLREENEKMEIKVRAFFQGNTDIEIPRENQAEAQAQEGEEAPNAVLPLVDLHAQNALRRRIVLDRLNRVLPDLLRTFGLASRDVTTDLRALFCTFTLSAHNITFKPAEWSLVGLVIIKMLSIRDMRLKMILDTEQASKYQTMMLMAFSQDGGYLERLLVWLTDIDNILQKPVHSKGIDGNLLQSCCTKKIT